ncbi:MAG: S8 family serine peptidase [Verrucomicrobia subdivision 3 bacterium]|nr:S8 family serine peptidase [Limisphaerales bacterium]
MKSETRTLNCALFLAALLLSEGTAPGSDVPQDPLFSKQRSLFEHLGVLEAWKLTRGSTNVTIGIIDQGFDFFHPDLAPHVKPGFYAHGGFHTETYDIIAHGTMVAGIIGAQNNDLGVSGMAPGCRILCASLGFIDHPIVKIRKRFEKELEWIPFLEEAMPVSFETDGSKGHNTAHALATRSSLCSQPLS